MIQNSIKRKLASIFLSGFVMWIVAGLWHNLIMANLYEEVHANHEGIGILLISYLILSSFMTLLYPRFARKGTLPEAVLWGAIIGLLWVFPHGLAMAGAHGDPLLYVFKNSAWHILEQGIGGIIVYETLKKNHKNSKLISSD